MSEQFDLGYMEGWEDSKEYILRCPHKFGLTKADSDQQKNRPRSDKQTVSKKEFD